MPCRFFFAKRCWKTMTTKDLLQEIFIKPVLESKRNYLTNAGGKPAKDQKKRAG